MFTGLIDHCGIILRVDPLPNAQRIWVESAFSDLALGESIAVDGICLTVTDIQENKFSCDLSLETLNITTAHYFKPQQNINLERALLPTTRLGGHFVSGHVDQMSSIHQLRAIGEFLEIEITSIDKKYLVPKGSIAVNGVSLTINAVTENGFTAMLIPHTLKQTNLHLLNKNDRVNIEFDMIAKIILKQSEPYLT